MVAGAVFVPETIAKLAIRCGTSRIPKMELLVVEGMIPMNNSSQDALCRCPA
jgi:hypothetical protein